MGGKILLTLASESISSKLILAKRKYLKFFQQLLAFRYLLAGQISWTWKKFYNHQPRLTVYDVMISFTVLKVKTSLRERIAQEPATMTPKIKAAVQVLIQSPSSRNGPSSALLTPSTKRSTCMLAPPMATPQRMHHKIPHRFVNGLNTRATKCAVCLGSVHFVKQAAKCQGTCNWHNVCKFDVFFLIVPKLANLLLPEGADNFL